MQENKATSPESENPATDSDTRPEDMTFDHIVVDSIDHISLTDIFPQDVQFNLKMTRSPEELGALNPPLPPLICADL